MSSPPFSTVLRCCVLFSLLLVFAAPAGADDFTVNTTADAADANTGNGICQTAAGACSLRAAIEQSNAPSSFGADQISVPAGTYNLTSAGPSATGSVTITGSGARQTIIDGVSNTTVLSMSAGTSTVRGVTLTGGFRGLSVDSGDVRVDEVTIRDNTMSNGSPYGAGLHVGAGGKVIMTRSAITNNHLISSGTTSMGGGVYVAATGVFTAISSTIIGNSSQASTSSWGGGVVSLGGAVTLKHVTLAGNSATSGTGAQSGGNVWVQGTGPLTLEDSIVAYGVAVSGANCAGPAPRVVTGRNIDSGTTCALPAGQLSSTDPQLESLADRGGQTDSASLKPSSLARDAAATCHEGSIDQRGAIAPAGAACDIGAAELGSDMAVALEASRTSLDPGGDVTFVARVSNRGLDAAPGSVLDVGVPAGQVILVTPATGACSLAIRCDLGTIPSGQTVTVTIVVRALAAGPLVAGASAAAGIPDPLAGNNAASLAVTVNGSSPLSTDRTAPLLGTLKLSGKARTGRKVTLLATLSETATVTLKVDRLLSGRRQGAKCSVTAKLGRSCTIIRKLGSARSVAKSGRPKLVLPAKLAGRKLAPGRYRITATATDAAGNRSKARTLTLLVVR